MKNYVKPIVTLNEEIAEGVYAASGDCWSISVAEVQEWNGSAKIFQVALSHSTAVEHISSASTVAITFNSPITSASAQEYSCSVSGNTVYITRTLLADAYKEGDSVTYKVTVSSVDEATTRALAVTGQTVSCTKVINVQGGGADEI